jgi:hypothetical protein
MVVVVPGFAKRWQDEPEDVSRFVIGREPTPPDTWQTELML